MSDPLETGMVQSLARPGGNLTGVSGDAGIEIWGKRLELLKEAVPSMAKLAYVGVQLAPGSRPSIIIGGRQGVDNTGYRITSGEEMP